MNIATRSALTCLRFLSLSPLDIAYRSYQPSSKLSSSSVPIFGGGRFLKPHGSGGVVVPGVDLPHTFKYESVCYLATYSCLDPGVTD